MYSLLRPLLFALPPHAAHAIASLGLGPVEHFSPLRALVRSRFAARDARLAVRRMGLSFPSPLGLAGGFDKDARRPRALSALGFGFLELGTVTARAQAENPRPNLFRLRADRALVNRLGFPNQGAARVVERFVSRGGREAAGVPVGFSIGKSRAVPLDPVEGVLADYLESFRRVRPVADFVVVNVSSPNTAGLRAMQSAELARALLGGLVAENEAGGAPLPLLVKIAPDLDDEGLEGLLAVVEELSLAGIVATNTTIARAGLKTSPAEIEAMGAGGLSGPPLRARALAVVARVRARLGRGPTVIGVGGVENADHALDLLFAGANLVQAYTGFVYAGPGLPRAISRGLIAELDRTGASSLEELVLSASERSPH